MKLKIKLPNITLSQTLYLYFCGKANNVKVTGHRRDGLICVHIHDFEFETFESAIRYLQEDARTIEHKSQEAA